MELSHDVDIDQLLVEFLASGRALTYVCCLARQTLLCCILVFRLCFSNYLLLLRVMQGFEHRLTHDDSNVLEIV